MDTRRILRPERRSCRMVTKLWLTVREVAPIYGRSEKAIYEQIRMGKFPFVFRRAGSAIYISARDIGLIPPETQKEDGEREATDANR